MKLEEKLDFIGKALEEEKEPLPVSLEKENVVSMLKGIETSQKKQARIMPFKKYASIAAALIIIVSAVVIGTNIKNVDQSLHSSDENAQEAFQVTDSAMNTQPLTAFETQTEDDYSEIENYFISKYKKIVERHERETADAYNGNIDEGYDLAVKDGNTNSFNGITTNSSTAFGDTNKQVDGVDEGDKIKNDGRYLYILNLYEKKISIVDAINMQQVSVIKDISLPTSEKAKDGTYYDYTLGDIYVTGDVLTVIATNRLYYSLSDSDAIYNSCPIGYGNDKPETFMLTYDISDRAQPKLISTHRQSGSYHYSRMIGNILYTVSFYDVYVQYDTNTDDIKNECVPKTDGKRIKLDNIKIDGNTSNNDESYVVISSFNVSENSDIISSYTYLGCCDELYATKESIYIVATTYGDNASDQDNDNSYITEIRKFSLDDGEIAFDAQGSVHGRIDDNYSMDEYNGYFRIVTTDMKVKSNGDSVNISSIYVLNETLNTVGKLVDIAKNETVQSVRFMQNTAYVVTYENTDPLFVIDLSDPTAPVIKGEVKLPGFSSYLHPIGDNYIIGVGYDGDDTEADWTSVKVTLFDVSDPISPKVADEIVVTDAETDVNYDTKAFMYYPEKQLVGIPTVIFNDYENAESKSYCEYKIISVENGKLKLKEALSHELFDGTQGSIPELFRGTYIDDTVYTVTEDGICSFDINSGKLINTLKLG